VPENIDIKRWRAPVEFNLPESYIKYYARDYLTRAMSAEGVQIRVQRQKNYEGGTLEFWQTLCRKALVENRAIKLTNEYEELLTTKAKANIKQGEVLIADQPYNYLVAVVVNRNYIYIYEVWGPKDHFAKDKNRLVKSVKSMRIKS